jgi:hypothetical protein
MRWKAEHQKIYETRVITDSLARLAKRFDLATLPFSGEELRTLATGARESFRAYGSDEKQRLAGYRTHLAGLYGDERVVPVWAALVEINNEIGYEEK